MGAWAFGRSAAVGLGLAGLVLLAAAGRLLSSQETRLQAPFRPSQAGIAAALTEEPLSARPFLAAALAEEPLNAGPGAGGSAERVIALLDEAVRRDPHDLAARLTLFRAQLLRGRLDAALGELAAARQLDAGVVDGMIARLAAVADDEQRVSEATDALVRHPALVAPFLRALAAGGASPALGAVPVGLIPSSLMKNDEIRGLAVQALVRAGHYDEARSLWLAGRNERSFVHSPDFGDISSPPPFGWTLSSGEAGAVERPEGSTGLEMVSYGRTEGVLASQTLVLQSGIWRLRVTYRPEGEVSGALVARLVCAGNGKVLTSGGLDGTGNVPRQLTISFAVPTGCEGQVLEIATRVEDNEQEQQIRMLRVDVERPS